MIHLIIAAILAGTPILFATVGETVTEKSGCLNLGVEGTMYIGAIAGLAAGTAAETQGATGLPVVILSVLAAIVSGITTSLLYAFLTVTLRCNQNVVGLAITIMGTGIGNFFGEFLGKVKNGNFYIQKIDAKMFSGNPFIFVKKVSGIGQFTSRFNWAVYLAVIICIFVWFFLYHTKTGRKLTAVGENPAAADAAFISVTKYRYFACAFGGMCSGLGGMYICMITNGGAWVHSCINGYGWLAVALVILGGWHPLKEIPCSFLFGMLLIMRLYVAIPNLSPYLYQMFPYIGAAVVLIISSMNKKHGDPMPKACGENYWREER